MFFRKNDKIYYSYALFGAVVIITALFLSMERMVTKQNMAPGIEQPRVLIDFVRLKREPTPLEVKKRVKPPVKQELDKPPPTPSLTNPKPRRVRVRNPDMKPPVMELPLRIDGMPFVGKINTGDIASMQEAIPLVRIPPTYPPSAIARGIEGTVKVEFTITESGEVKNPIILESNPRRMFDRSVLRSIRGWKFESKFVNGEPVPWHTVQTIHFKLNK